MPDIWSWAIILILLAVGSLLCHDAHLNTQCYDSSNSTNIQPVPPKLQPYSALNKLLFSFSPIILLPLNPWYLCQRVKVLTIYLSYTSLILCISAFSAPNPVFLTAEIDHYKQHSIEIPPHRLQCSRNFPWCGDHNYMYYSSCNLINALQSGIITSLCL